VALAAGQLPAWPSWTALAGASLVSRYRPPYSVRWCPSCWRGVLAYVALAARISARSHRPVVLSRRRTILASAAISAIGLYDGFFRSPAPETFLMLAVRTGCTEFDFLKRNPRPPRLINVADQMPGPWCISACMPTSTGQVGLCLGVLQRGRAASQGIRTARPSRDTVFVRIVFHRRGVRAPSRKTGLGIGFRIALGNLSDLHFPLLRSRPKTTLFCRAGNEKLKCPNKRAGSAFLVDRRVDPTGAVQGGETHCVRTGGQDGHPGLARKQGIA